MTDTKLLIFACLAVIGSATASGKPNKMRAMGFLGGSVGGGSVAQRVSRVAFLFAASIFKRL